MNEQSEQFLSEAKERILANIKKRIAMSKVVIENDQIKVTDLGDGTTDVYFKDRNEIINYSNDEIRQAIAYTMRAKSSAVTAYSHLN